jgi:hypothetical protein
VLSFISGLAKEIPAPSETDSKKWADMVNPIKNLQHPSNDECLVSDGPFVLRMLSEFHLRFAKSCCVLAESSGIVLGQRHKPGRTEATNDLYFALEKVWKVVHRCLRLLLAKECEEGVTQNTLNTVQAYVNLTGTTQMK